MNIDKLIILLAACLLLLCACGDGNKKRQTGDLPVIDLSKNHPKKEFILQDIADVEYIALETRDDILLGHYAIIRYISDNFIIINDFELGDVFVFDRKGKAISHFNHRGQGPREYNRASHMVFDENAREIFVCDGLTDRILVYSISGEYKRSLTTPTELNIGRGRVQNFDNETILVGGGMSLSSGGLVFSEIPYLLLSKQDGSAVEYIDITLPRRYSNRIAQEFTGADGEQMFMPLDIIIRNNWHFGQDFVIADISSDTIYKLAQDRHLTPLLTRTPSVHNSEPRVVWSTLLNTDRYILLEKTTLDFDAAERGRFIPPVRLLHEFETGETYEVTLVDADLGRWIIGSVLSPSISKNMDAHDVQVWRFLDAYEEGKLPEELEQLAAGLEAEDNFVVRIMTFK
jgi:hypothetical protein